MRGRENGMPVVAAPVADGDVEALEGSRIVFGGGSRDRVPGRKGRLLFGCVGGHGAFVEATASSDAVSGGLAGAARKDCFFVSDYESSRCNQVSEEGAAAQASCCNGKGVSVNAAGKEMGRKNLTFSDG